MKRNRKCRKKRNKRPWDFERIIDLLEFILGVIFYGYLAATVLYFYWLSLQKP